MLEDMVGAVGIAGLRARKAAREARILALVQSVVIFLLLVFVAEEYDHNEYLQAWAGVHLAGLGFLLNGTLAAFYAGVVIAVYLNRPGPAVVRKERRPEEIPVVPKTQ